MHDNFMWVGTIYGGEMVACPQMGPDMSPQGFAESGTLIDGGGFGFGSTDSHREYSFTWSNTESQTEADKMHRLRDGWHSMDSRDLIHFIEPFAARSNALPKRWAQPSIMLDDNVLGFTDTLMGRLRPVASPFPAHKNIPKRVVRVEALQAAPTRPYGRALFVPATPLDQLYVGFLAKAVAGVAGSGMFMREVRSDGTFGSEVSLTSSSGITTTIIPALDTASTAIKPTGSIFYFRGQVDFAGGVAVMRSEIGAVPTTAARLSDLLRPGMGNSGCKFVGNPTIIGTSAVMGRDAYVGFATSLIEVGDWYQ